MAKGKRTPLPGNFRAGAALIILLMFVLHGHAQTFNPSVHVTINDALGQGQAAPIDGRSMFYDGTNFLYRPYQSTNEVYSYLNLSKYRSGNFIIVVDSGGTLQGNGTYINGSNTFWTFKDSTTNAGLIKMNLFGIGIGTCSSCLQVANNLSDLASLSTALTNLSLNNVNNTSDATKNAATVALTNHTIDASLNTLLNIPNSALANKTIGLTLNNLGTNPAVTTTPAALGNSLVLSVPISNGTNSGFLSAANWSFFDGKLDSIHISNDSIYNCVNGTCTLQSVVSSFGPVSAVNATNPSLIFFPSTGLVLGQVNPAYDFTWSGQHTFTGFAPIFSSLTTNGGLFYGNAFGQLLQTGGGTTGQLLQSNGGAPPSFFTVNAATVDGWLGYTPLSAALPSTQIYVGNGSGVATAVVASGDWTINNVGVNTLKNTGPGAGSCTGCNLSLDAQGRVTAYAAGTGDSSVLAGFGILKQVSGTNITLLTDTTLTYFPYYVVTGLNDKIVGDGNSNSVGYPRGIDSSYPTGSFNLLGGSAAGWTLDVLGVPSQTTTQMIANAPTVIDTAYDGSKTQNYLFAWEMENDIPANNLSSFQAVTNMNTYYTARNLVGWRTIGATALEKANGSNNFDSLETYRVDSANLYLATTHTSDLFIDFRGNPWLTNNMSRAGFLGDHTHMNASGTLEMADSFALKVKTDLGQPAMPVPALPVFSGGNVTDRNMVIGPRTAFGISFLANNSAVFDVTQYGKIAFVGKTVAEASNIPSVGFDIVPSFWNPNGYTNTTNYDIRLNAESQWINNVGNKIAFFNPAGTIDNTGFGIDIFANLQPGQSTYYFNSGFGTHLFQGATPGLFNTMVGSFSSDVHTSNGNVITAAGLAVPAIGNNNTWAGANGSLAASTISSTTIGYGNTQAANYGIAIGTSNTISGTSTHTGGSIAIGYNQNDGGFRGIFIGNLESAAYGNMPTADGQCIIGDIYNGSGYKSIKSFFFGGNQALNSGIQAAFAAIHFTVPGVAAGGSNTNLSSSASEIDWDGSIGTGNAASGDIVFSTGQATTSGTARQSLVKMLRVGADQTVDIGEPASHPFGTNINTSVGLNKDSASQIAPISTTQLLVINTATNKINRIPLGGILATNDLTAQSAAIGTVTSYAVPGSGSFNTFRVGGYITVTAVTLSPLIQLQVTYTDETSTSRTQSFFVQGATTGISVTGANGYSPIDIRVKQGTTITMSTTVGGTGTETYDVGASITQLY
jgi:hypothetical protein